MIMDKTSEKTVAADLASTLGTAKTARAWLAEATQNTTHELIAQQALLAVGVALEAKLPGTAEQGTIERAIARGKWQNAYDTAMHLPLGGPAALARVLLVADGLNEVGAPEASLNILGRAVDTYSDTPQVYSRLADVLGTLGRSDDAEMAQTLAREYTTNEIIGA